MSSIAAEDTRSSTVARNSAQLNFSIATCFQRSRRVVFAESTIASSKFLFSDFRTTRLGSTKSGRRPPVTACSSKSIRPSRRSLEMCCSKERPARDFKLAMADALSSTPQHAILCYPCLKRYPFRQLAARKIFTQGKLTFSISRIYDHD